MESIIIERKPGEESEKFFRRVNRKYNETKKFNPDNHITKGKIPGSVKGQIGGLKYIVIRVWNTPRKKDFIY